MQGFDVNEDILFGLLDVSQFEMLSVTANEVIGDHPAHRDRSIILGGFRHGRSIQP
jgi:hypothetical protein